jgi:hypothetical protein
MRLFRYTRLAEWVCVADGMHQILLGRGLSGNFPNGNVMDYAADNWEICDQTMRSLNT